MDNIVNRPLFEQKIKALDDFQISFQAQLFKHTISCSYHGIALKIHTQSEKIGRSLLNFIPQSWLKFEDGAYDIFLLNPIHFGYSLEAWSSETSQDCISLENNLKAVQRDFAAWAISKKQILLICEDSVEDGFHNFLRWFISERLIANNKFVIHASCVLDKYNFAHIFLGHSGAGKTTITKLSAPRLTLGDDMNIISLHNSELVVEAGAIGGLFNSMIGYDRPVKVKAIYWLNQSSQNSLEKLPLSIGQQKLLASFANLHWPTLPKKTEQKLVNFALEAISKVDSFNLHFKKDSSIWELLDP